MEKYFDISYEVVGSKRIDTVMIWAKTISEAIKLFTKTEINHNGIKVIYTEYAIVSIKC